MVTSREQVAETQRIQREAYEAFIRSEQIRLAPEVGAKALGATLDTTEDLAVSFITVGVFEGAGHHQPEQAATESLENTESLFSQKLNRHLGETGMNAAQIAQPEASIPLHLRQTFEGYAQRPRSDFALGA